MTKTEYVSHLRALYLAANLSDSEDAPDWMNGNECATHCRRYEKIVREMGLSDNWLEEGA